ncbi:MAG: PD-(D/E)XK nuclease family protein [Prevotella sp.]|uniref:PD-(D/E)XK nuclease family protein n=1 Tax=Prevotella sp. TaxID=59823 RepID=UPI002A25F0C0|nr:PD-(D/E)XK nuclease family protein [Prevotella sp.]MDD7317885.1 PD-(D/E)XK nuclease family protein [Prevotellaceae bacterium]MDY4019674.1 PD-(D/E)XK nuclease family protein [Prevotella sp.]
MTSFLEHIAEDIIAKHGTDLSDITIVFPNKRASLFLNEALAAKAGKPMWSPQYVTISELFRSQTETVVADPIKSVCELFKVYSVYHPSADLTLDKFYGWGQLLIADFDDIDKNMADADAVFSNIQAYHELETKIELTEKQREAIEHFFNIVIDSNDSKLKENFVKVWNSLAEIYHKFNERLAEEGLAYEGALYRKVIEEGHLRLNSGIYVFVGFNVVQQVESRLFSMLKEEGRARFYWDYDEYFMNGQNTVKNEAGKYIAQLREKFHNELLPQRTDVFDTMKEHKDIKYICAPTENIQARYVSQWLKENNRMYDGRRTAIVICDETLLRTIIHCLPSDIPAVNVTTGYPLSQAPVTTLIADFLALHSEGYDSERHVFRLHFVNSVLSHPYARYVSEKALPLRNELNIRHRYFPKAEEMMLDEGLSLLFNAMDEASGSLNGLITKRMADIVKHIATHFPNDNTQENGFAVESLFRAYTLLTRIENLIAAGDLVIGFETLRKLIMQIIGTTSIPFHGEPAEGVQIMGVLETRNLDFDHVLILSCNEGNMPKGVNDSSFIPHAIRYGHGLTTIENKVSVYAYYFNSIMQRCSDVTIVYNNSTEGGQTGEMSRFMVQMMVEKPETWNISKQALSAGQHYIEAKSGEIGKGGDVAAILNKIDKLSPTAINNYLFCQLRFFYRYVAGLKESNEADDDTIDNRIFGLIFHKATEILYNKVRSSTITRSILQAMLKDEAGIDRAIDEAFRTELFKVGDNSAFQPKYNGIQLINRAVIRQYVKMLLRLDIKLAPFTIIGLEREVFEDITIRTNRGDRTVKVGGTIDRMDKIADPKSGMEMIRVIDYKTSAKEIKSPLADVDAVFDPKAKRDSHRDYYFQSMLYSMIVSRQQEGDRKPVAPALLFIQHAYAEDTNPMLFFKPGKEEEYIRDMATLEEPFMGNTKRVIAEILDTSTTFIPTEVDERCNLCPYKKLCR